MGLPQPLLRCVLWAAIFTGITAQTPNFLAVAPRIIHVGVEESVGVQFEWPSGSSPPAGDIQVILYLRNQLNMLRCSEQKTVILNRANNYIKTEKLQITFLQATTCKLDTTKVNRYVQLAVESSVLGGKTRAVSIPVSYQRGYLFIQTDKSIYTPKEKVQYRVFCLDHMMRPSNENIILSVFNAQGVQVKRNEQFAANAMIPGSLLIPDISTPGTWKITAQYSTAPGTNFTTEFEVKKYVLPNFEVKIIPDVPYFLISKNELRFKVEARYVYGEPVDGVAYVRVGIIDKDGQKSMLRGLEQQVKLKEGSMDITITKANISEKIKQPLDNLIGTNFYIAASVVEIASGALEEKELTSVKIVASPYILDLSKTKKYYIPSTPVHIVAEVSHADGSPAKGVDVRFTGLNGKVETIKSNDNGVATIHHNLNQDPKSLELTVSAGTSEGSVVETLHLLPYSSSTKSFLHMSVPYQVLSPGESVRVTLKVVSAKENDVKKIYYMVLSKGQIISLNYISKSDYIELHIPVTSSMVPSFRIVAYYHLHSEIVANSAWVDVTDECEGKLTLSHTVKDYIEPGLSFNLDVVTDDKAFVSLSVVDTAVYILNSKNKLTLGKMFKAMNLYDLGCSPGGGKDYKNVFMDAGLAFVSKDEYSNLNGFSCKASQRKKRNIEFSVLTQQKVNSYPTRELQRCCGDGMTLLPRKMKRTCVQRAVRIPSQSCKEAFRTCCDYAEKLRLEITLKKRKTPGLGRTQEVGQDDEDFADENDIQYRTNFPESWFFQTMFVDKKKSIHLNVPDSITTWEIQGIGMSDRKGFCIAEPVKLKVFKPFHIHLRVPYSIKRFEQMEIRPVLYNYNDEQLKVRVYMEQTEGICSPAKDSEGSDHGIRLTLPAKSATAVSFPVVPIGKSNPVITIVALGQNGITDSIRKPLKIVREGSQVLEEKTYIVDPKDPARSIITIDDDLPSNLIPDEDFHSSIRMTVDSPLNTINNSLGAEGISNLIRVPSGCAEQTMIRTAPGVYALRYLDHTEKWIMLPPERKDEGMENMKQGYMRILQFRKNDGSYGAWLERKSSTWLTAFVVKVLSLARKYIGVDVEDIRISAKYLTTMQNTDGSFREILSVIHTDMKGGVDGVNAGISLTAYVTIALHHSLESLSENYEEVKKIISKANEYLRNNLDSLSEPYPLAITAYALTLTSVDPTLKDKAFRLLMNIGQEDTKKRELFFGSRNSALAVETTAYALLTALLRKETTTAKMMYTWLTEQQNYGGGFKSTQDTVMALEAMSEYWITTYKEEQTALEVQVQSLERKKDRTFFLRSEDNVQEQLSLGTKFNIKVSGKGKATLTVLKQYNVMQTENSTCNDLGLEVKVSGDDTATKDDNDYNYDYGDDGEGDSADEPRGAIEWHDLRKRARREVSQPKEKEVKVSYEVCIWKKLHAKVSGMAIVDITMLSGFVPNAEDLYKLKTSSERYISHYEIQAGRLLLYFDEVSESKECISFDAIQTVRISLLQPASAILYDFYEPERKCNVFYGAPSKSKFIDTLCSKDVCQCAEGLCPIKQRSLALAENDRQTFACYSPRVVYGYHVRVENIKEEDAFVVYKTKILDVLQKNADENIDKEKMRFFLQRKSCKLRLELKEYLIMGQDGQTKDDKGQIRYLLEDNSWIEELLSPPKCAATRFRNMCLSIKTFMENYKSDGCMV